MTTLTKRSLNSEKDALRVNGQSTDAGVLCSECGTEGVVILDSSFHRFLCLPCNRLWDMQDEGISPKPWLS